MITLACDDEAHELAPALAHDLAKQSYRL